MIAAYDYAHLGEGTITIVDNGSSPETVSRLSCWLKESHSRKIELVLNRENVGFSAGMNSGIRHSQGISRSDYLWLLNNDLHLAPGALAELIAATQRRPEVVIWGPTVLSQGDSKVECAGGCRYYPMVGYARECYRGRDPGELSHLPTPRIDYVYGAAMFCRSDFIAQIGGLDERYFLYYEELELAQKLNSNQALDWCRKSVVHHAGGGSSSSPGVDYIKTREAALSAFKYTWKYCPYYIASVFIARLTGTLLRGISRLDPGPPRAVIAAMIQFIKNGTG